MTRQFIVRPEADADMDDAYDWYELQNPGLGATFQQAVLTSLRKIQQHPFSYQVIYDETRHAPLNRFPYVLLYFVTDTTVVITACFHDKRDPNIWQSRT
ncbi:MAG: type II toxin-antitoxin system RelE/ParE family toxin [Acidobacteria bacterium]|nr:type II toxin-antitoxin system RelE/ParE family toxin [Acidobacteriota bacterium]